MIRQRSSAGSAYQARVLTNGYTNRYLPCPGRTSRRDSSEYSDGLVMASSEYGTVHHFISPLWASTTWNSWIRSRFWAWLSSSRSASPRVPTSEKERSRWPSAKSSQAAMNSRLSAGALLGVEPPPGRIDLEERVLDEMPGGHRGSMIGDPETLFPGRGRG